MQSEYCLAHRKGPIWAMQGEDFDGVKAERAFRN